MSSVLKWIAKYDEYPGNYDIIQAISANKGDKNLLTNIINILEWLYLENKNLPYGYTRFIIDLVGLNVNSKL